MPKINSKLIGYLMILSSIILGVTGISTITKIQSLIISQAVKMANASESGIDQWPELAFALCLPLAMVTVFLFFFGLQLVSKRLEIVRPGVTAQ
ncbi:TPA: hypothetical protein ONB34_001637 [Pseudomonas aeruginosa]|uniref:Uncharacterized protein n=1 Tax=Pseudomonas aeruginosa TaxID=287 RepID=A0ABD7JTR8_PSEAI|nr:MULTISPECIES: hypothetical protein [Pseudomonas]AVX92851.1 hypothetical protein PkP19E3_32440 [Pseudomonas koreensis]EKB9387720.1 hypothetical protein [Pseudomonas aeruginosa]EKD1543871.1 hypothetical protein [Pseudomonas aeruginosa]EKU2925321.1 hypothetical protein [Pseudomonas aeruginosa]EKU4830263.1 hypothetical protein [Pseudomonas aeruginosa]